MSDHLLAQLSTLTELRAMVLAFRRRSISATENRVDRRRDIETDDELLAVMAEPFQSARDAYVRLGNAEAHLRNRSDRRSVFLTVYTEMTASVREGIESGVFDDPDWVRAYLTTFANWYRSALLNFERGNLAEVPTAWRTGFRASTSNYTLLIQDALLGINAHISYDLPFALREVTIDPDRPSKLRDHNRINEILHQLVDVIQRALADIYDAGGYTHVDSLLGSFDEDFTLLGLTEARSLAWRNAVLLTDTGSSLVRRFVNWRVEVVASGAGYFILGPTVDPSVLWALRQVEGDDPPIDVLSDTFHRRADERTISVE